MDRDIVYALSGELLPGEIILWAGKPNISVHLNRTDVLLIPFSMLWFGFAIFWTIGASKAGGAFGLFGIPFVLVGLYLFLGRFFIKAHRKRRTGYAISNRRVIMITVDATGNRKSTTSVEINNIQNESLLAGRQMTGSILFGTMPAYSNYYLNTGMEGLVSSQSSSIFAFYDIDDAEQVYAIYKRVKYGNEPSSS
jgi:hypothetical protein